MGAWLAGAAAADWEWFMTHRKSALIVRRFGRGGARVVYGTLGAVLIGAGGLLVAGASLSPGVLARTQAVPPVELSAPLRDQVKDGRFGMVTAVRGLPLGVRDGLQRLFSSPTLAIVDPGAAFQATGATVNPAFPPRRLVAAGCTVDYCLVYYERGGTAHTWHVALFHWTPDATQFEWGGLAPRGLVTFDDVRNAVLSGAIRAPDGVW